MKSSPLLRPSALPPPKITGRGIALSAACWVLYSAFYSFIVMYGQGVPFIGVFMGQISQNTFLAILSAGIWVMVVSKMDQRAWFEKLGFHVILAPIYAWIGVQALLFFASTSTGPSEFNEIREAYPFLFSSNIIAYIVQFSVYHMVRSSQRSQYQQTQAMELYALAKEQELNQLKAQIHPHFMFNALHSIGVIAEHDPGKVRTLILHLADMMRYSLDISRMDLVPLAEEIEFIRAYLEIEQTRFSDRLKIQYDLDEEALQTMILPMTLQPLVENAIKHGISPSESGGTLIIRAIISNDTLSISIEDDGVGIDAAPAKDSNGIGISNTNARLVNRFGSSSRLLTEANVPRGYRASFSIPL